MSAPALKRLLAGRRFLILNNPFFGSLLLRLPFKEAPELTDTMSTDGRTLFYNAAFVDTLTDSEIHGMLAHEVMHPAMQHHTRRGKRDPKRWNVAADLAINPLLLEAGFTLPKGSIHDAQYAGLSAESIYARLPQQPKEDEQGGGNSNGDGSNAGPDAGDSPAPGGVMDAPEPAQDAAEWHVAVTQATNAARMMGKLPASLVKEVAEQTAPVVDWRALLRRFVQMSARSDYSWTMPNTRYVAGGIFLPAVRSEALPPVAIVIDTSGSISDATLDAFRAEVSSIIDECNPERTHVIYCDAEVAHADTFERGEPLTMQRHGGGGTDFRPAFDHVDGEGIAPACLIYLTDGYGIYPESAPGYPVLWAMTSGKTAPWGETVKLSEVAF